MELATAAPSASAGPVASSALIPPKLPVSDAFKVTRLFDKPVDFFITGEKGRLGVIAREDDQAVPYRFQNGKWEKLPLPKPVAAASLHAGIYFGRDNLPRLMGWRDDGGKLALVYLQHKGKWEDAKSEIGGMAKLPATPLFGVLGEADPEAVCRLGDTCLMKRRSGWKQVASPELPAQAIVRAFNGDGYALYESGLFRQGEKGFDPIGGAAPWKKPRGFWIGADGGAIVAADASLYVRAAGALDWSSQPLDATDVLDVVGPADAPIAVVASGVVRRGPAGLERIGEEGLSLDRVIAVDATVYVAGESGVFALEKK